MRLDHIAYRVNSRDKTAKFLIDAFGYKIQTEFDLNFDDGSTTKCIALEPSEKANNELRIFHDPFKDDEDENEYHVPPELFVSDGSPDSIVGKWVAERNGVGGIHHLAYEVDDVAKTMKIWKKNGWATFASQAPLTCPGLIQVFTDVHPLTGVIYEFIKREGEYGFCAENVKNLMLSTKER